jgi:PKD repeat protein
MKPSLTLTLIFVAILSACAREKSTPTTPSQPSVQLPTPPFVSLFSDPRPAVANEATTFTASIARAYSSGSATMDFGDGTRADLGPLSSVSATFFHVYTRAGNFTATFSVRDTAGKTASGSTIVVVR